MSTPGTARKAAAPTSARKVTAATHHAGWIRRRTGRSVTPRSIADRLDVGASGPTANMCKDSAMTARGRRPRPAVGRRRSSSGCRTSCSAGRSTRRASRSTGCGSPRVDGGPVRTSAGYSVLPGARRLDPAHGRHRRRPGHPPRGGGGARRAGGRRRRGARRRSHARLVSICTGAFVLAAAGLLDGRPATTHWMHTAAFRRLFPAVRLDPDVLFVDDGDVLTSAGNAAGIDLLPAPRPPRPRQRGGQPGGPAQRGRAVAGGRAVAVRRAAARRRGRGHGGHPRLGARPARASR